jgi:predicted Zn-dependent protease
VNSSKNFIVNDDLNAYLSDIVSILKPLTKKPNINYQVKVTNEEHIDIYAVQDGNIYITKGLLKLTKNESELVGLIAYEMNYIAEREGTAYHKRALKRTMKTTMLEMAASGLFGVSPGLIGDFAIAGLEAEELVKQDIESKQKLERKAINMMYDNNWNGRGLLSIVQSIWENSNNGLKQCKYFDSHNTLDDRSLAISNIISEHRSIESDLVTNTQRYQRVMGQIL